MTEARDHPTKAACAARTAASTSRAPDSGTCSITSPVAGLKMGRLSAASEASRHSSPTRLRINVDTVLLMAPSARELLEQAAASGGDLETVARGVLERLADLTGLSSTYLAETRLMTDEQYIVFSCNRSDLFHIPEDVTLPWPQGVCRFVAKGLPHSTPAPHTQFPSSSVARILEIRTFVSYPLFTPEGRFFATL